VLEENYIQRAFSKDNGGIADAIEELRAELRATVTQDDLVVTFAVNRLSLTVERRLLKRMTISKRLPGTSLGRIAYLLFDRKTNVLIVAPHIADMRLEYFEAISKGRATEARWIQVRETGRFFYVLCVHRILKAIANLFSHPKMQ
jgi:hypothetical protein